MKKKIFGALLFSVLSCFTAMAQNPSLTRESVLNMTVDDLSELPLEDLMYAVELLDVKSVDELFALIMNKNVSSASKKAEDSFNSPLSTSVITREEMRMWGCTTIEEALRMLPGVIAREKTNGNYDIHLRGLDNIPDGHWFLYTENANTLVMINNRPVYNYAQGTTMWETLPVSIEDVARIEVVRGASSALYGANAVTGVINIITETPTTDSKLVSGAFQSGSQNTYVGDIAFRRAFNDKWAASISGNYQMRDRSTSDIYIIGGQGIKSSSDPDFDSETGGFVSVDDLDDLYIESQGSQYAISEKSASLSDMFEDSDLARKSLGINAQISYVPSADVMMNLMAGYQQSDEMSTPVGFDYFPVNRRTSKQYYIDFRANIKGLDFMINYCDGPQNFMVGAPSFKIRNQLFTTTLEYDWRVLDNLTIRPGFNYRWTQFDDNDYQDIWGENKFGETVQLSSFFNGAAKLSQFAGSVRFDYSPIEQLRLIGAYRLEKYNVPDKYYSSWQAAATYSLNDNNNLRLIYSRANRSAIMTNTSANYTMIRLGLSLPDEVRFEGNEDADVMYADNFEIGYRWRPASNVIIDAEAFYNISQDYGALMAESSHLEITSERLQTLVGTTIPSYLIQAMSGAITSEEATQGISAAASSIYTASSVIKYNNLPYKAKQMGISIALDWIISEKWIAKFSGNIQQTKIDNYYLYSQNDDITKTLTAAATKYSSGISETVNIIASGNGEMLANLVGEAPYEQYLDGYNATLDANGNETDASLEYLQQFYNAEGIGIYYALRYSINYENDSDLFTIADTRDTSPRATEDDHKHKSTPSYYGSLGLVYKPVTQLSLAANAYFYGKQKTTTTYGTETVDAKCIVNLKVGYRPTEQFEIFFNAHNLLNDDKREFVYLDPIKGIYSVGINFGF